ncbi:universal stress protein [Methanoplanus sp. FWC-SCC4]|uniref:Universal stress protein n=1 Tax=Methanochimaera problematica TaxID=2609417 RepID=A0AA97I494_9EURY|nr:universal stress protein [Methanoplanus sp. FWC-SCC4]WOF16706.1 universal stress protein [Methanoplanus sp. FWC-SCC4]
MYKRILVGIDGSEPSIKALKKALSLAKGWNAKLYGLYVINPGIYGASVVDPSMGVVDPSSERIFNMLRDEGWQIIEEAKKIALEEGAGGDFDMKFGDARDEMLDYAEKTSADLIIVGSTGKGMAKRLLLGSVSSAIVSHSKVSVLVVR